MVILREAWALLKQTVHEWLADQAPQLGAALAFYSALSLAPLLVLALSVAATFFDEAAVRGELDHQIESLVGADGARAVQDMVANASKPASGRWATILSVATLVFAASGVFAQLQSSLNAIWDVAPDPSRGWGGLLRDRVLSFAMVIVIAFLLLVSLVATTVVSSLIALLPDLPGGTAWLYRLAETLLSLSVATLLFATMFRLLPDVRMAWNDVWLGAFVTALLFTLGKYGIGVYLGQSSLASSYGVAGSFVVLLVWIYYSAQILFFGAELTQVYADRFGSRITPAPGAVVAHQKPHAERQA